jgi:hypothetical protein
MSKIRYASEIYVYRVESGRLVEIEQATVAGRAG